MAIIRDYDVPNMLSDYLMKNLQNSVGEKIMNEMTEDFKKRIEPIVKEEVEKISIQGVDAIKDMMEQRIDVLIQWNRQAEGEDS